jgi:hypothetical protein
MTVELGRLKDYIGADKRAAHDVGVWASNYDADYLWLSAGNSFCEVELQLTRAQLQELSKIIDRFLDR